MSISTHILEILPKTYFCTGRINWKFEMAGKPMRKTNEIEPKYLKTTYKGEL